MEQTTQSDSATTKSTIIKQQSSSNTISKFDNQYDFLNLAYPCTITFNNVKFTSAAQIFYAQKSLDTNSYIKFSRLNPNKARAKAANLPDPENYDELKMDHLYNANKLKFDQNPSLKKKLLKLKDKKLINNVLYRGEWIGVYLGKGKNALGKVLMKLRDEYLAEQESEKTNENN